MLKLSLNAAVSIVYVVESETCIKSVLITSQCFPH